MKLSYSTNGFVHGPLTQAVESIARIGYRGVELLADRPHMDPCSFSAGDLSRLKETLARTGIRVANINANTAAAYYGRDFWEPLFEPSLAHPDPSLRQWRIDYTRRCIDLAAELDCRNVSVTSGRMQPGVPPDRSRELLEESLERVLRHARGRGVRIGMEYEPGLLVERFEEWRALAAQLNSPVFGANWDVGHSHVLGEDPGEVIEGLQPRLFHVHVEDIRSRKHYHLIPGEGDMDLAHLMDLFARHRYEGFLTVELYTYPHRAEEAARRSLEVLRPMVQGAIARRQERETR
ncbi:MAG TPA: sugar phosphate isomerase/epimerase family protein [Syntrophobacteraceae bacterium]|nr:sugar phosphate isomerase/epimerase family protein [Syntrophobacteraceae bacterium]